MRRLALAALAVFAAGCADDDALADHPGEPLCGHEGPVELLRLADDEAVWATVVDDDGNRQVRTYSIADDDFVAIRRLVMDPCGEVFGEPSADVGWMHRWGDVVFGSSAWDLVLLEDYFDPSPELLIREASVMQDTSRGKVVHDIDAASGRGRVVGLEPTAGSVAVRVLLEEVLISQPHGARGVTVVDDRVFARTPDLRVVSVDPAGEGLRIEAEGAGEWHASTSFVVFQAAAAGTHGEGSLILHDRQSGTETVLAPGVSPAIYVELLTDELVKITVSVDYAAPRLWFQTRPAREIVPPPGHRIVTIRSDGLVWLERFDPETTFTDISRWREGQTPESLLRCLDCRVADAWSGPRVDVLVTTDPYLRLGDVWRIDDAGGKARRIASPVSDDWAVLADGRVLTELDSRSGDEVAGPLLLYETWPADPTVLAPRVRRHTIWNFGYPQSPDEILFEAMPFDGPHALVRARLPPPFEP